MDISSMLREAAQTGFYGSIEIKFESGKIVLIRTTENYKPPMEHPRHAGTNPR
jgi:hypothetical protein